MSVTGLSPSACCKKCGYRLHGLSEHVCPECGRPFNPADRRTYVANPARRRRIKWAIRAGVVLLLAADGWAFFPRQVDTGTARFECERCGHVHVFKRWHVRSPAWLGVTYARLPWDWTDDRPPGEAASVGDSATATQPGGPLTATSRPACASHRLLVSWTVDGYARIKAKFGKRRSGSVTFNDVPLTPETAQTCLDALMSPENDFTLGMRAVKDDENAMP